MSFDYKPIGINMTLNFVLGNNSDHPGGKCNFSPVRRVGDMKLEQEAI